MNDRTGLWAGLAGIGLVALCCGGPLLFGAVGVLSVSALAGWTIPVVLSGVGLLVIVAGLVWYVRVRRTHAASKCCDDRTGTSLRNL